MAQENKKGTRKTVWILILILLLLLLISAAVLFFLLNKSDEFHPSDFHKTETLVPPSGSASTDTTAPTAETEGQESSDNVFPTIHGSLEFPPFPENSTGDFQDHPLAENPIDFMTLQEVNEDAYAWLYIPMGKAEWNVDLPILHPRLLDDDNFYLHHNIYRKYEYTGCLYTQKCNNRDFSDPVTVIYGHNMYDDRTDMFSKLTNFQDADFFREHEFFYIYTPGHILTYRIAAAIRFDNRHILNSFDFTDETVFQNWITNYILNPKTTIKNVREDLEITTEDKIVILSTCLGRNMSDYRYLVQGVLISDEPTK